MLCLVRSHLQGKLGGSGIPKFSELELANIYLVHQMILSVLNTRRQALLWDHNTGNTVHHIRTNIIYPVAFGELLIILICSSIICCLVYKKI